jgi:hypothetical protein
MSYFDLTPGTYTPRKLADEINIDVDEDRGRYDTLSSIVIALEDVQYLSGDDDVKWEVIARLTEALNDLEPDMDVEVTDREVKVYH